MKTSKSTTTLLILAIFLSLHLDPVSSTKQVETPQTHQSSRAAIPLIRARRRSLGLSRRRITATASTQFQERDVNESALEMLRAAHEVAIREAAERASLAAAKAEAERLAAKAKELAAGNGNAADGTAGGGQSENIGTEESAGDAEDTTGGN